MKFSVITPAFNGMPHITKCIGSVRRQISDSIQVEHLVQDGLSKDDTVDFIQEFETRPDVTSQEKYCFLSQSESDEGMYDAINKGWARATGDILSWLNHDEQYLTGTLEKVAEVFAADSSVDIVFGNMIIVDSNGNPLAARREIPLRSFYVRNDFLYAISCTTFFRRRLLDEGLLVFDTVYKAAGDMDLIMKLISSGKKVEHIPEYLALFGVDGSNLTVSLGSTMNDETRDIQKKYGGFGMTPLRKAVKGLRFLERAFTGCYLPDDVSFAFVENEAAELRTISAKSLSFRFTYERANKLVNSND
jgi:glycosyltransferase involved in cell wall biosynthesis